jgi:hypothetical protein
MSSERESISFKRKVGELAVDLILPERAFKRELSREIRVCLEFFKDSLSKSNPVMVKGIGITIGRLGSEGRVGKAVDLAKGRQRGYFWELNGVRHIVGKEIMSRKEERQVLAKIHGITFPYKESEFWTKPDAEIFKTSKS